MSSNEYMNAYMKKRYHAKREEWILAKGGACVDCGSTETLEFDHADRATKAFTIAKLWSFSTEKVAVELEKCVLRCKTCHLKKTGGELGVEHGGGVSGKKNCKCGPCKARKAEYNRRYRKKD